MSEICRYKKFLKTTSQKEPASTHTASSNPVVFEPSKETITTTTTTENRVQDNTINVTSSATDIEIERKVE